MGVLEGWYELDGYEYLKKTNIVQSRAHCRFTTIENKDM